MVHKTEIERVGRRLPTLLGDDRYDYLPEKRKALEKWERWLKSVILGLEEKRSNVVPIKLTV